MNGLRTADCVLRTGVAAILLLGVGCKAPDEGPTPWEIVHGTAALAASKAVHPDSLTQLASYPTRTGTITVADDSGVAGWIRLTAIDTAFFTGTLTDDGSGLLVTLTGLTPGEYTVITSGSFPDTYALLSTAILTSDVTGDAVPEQHRIYWEFHR